MVDDKDKIDMDGEKQNISNNGDGSATAKKSNPIVTILKDFIKYWKAPKDGNSVSNKEMVVFSGGGIGVKTLVSLNTWLQMTSTCLLVGTVYKLSPTHILILFLLTNIISVIKTPLVSWLVDNTNTKFGKFRPYLFWAGIPAVFGACAMVWFVPLSATPLVKCVLIAIFYNIYFIGQQLYVNAYQGLSQVISPSSAERGKILSISEFIANLGPSIVTALLPMLAGFWAIKDENGDVILEGMKQLISYQVLIPIFALLGFGLGLVVMFTTKERVIINKTIKQKVSFMKGIKLVGRNADFWIVSCSKFFEGFKGAVGLLVNWVVMYQVTKSFVGNDMLLGVIPTITATGFIPGMLLAPWLMKKLGSGRAAALSYGMNVLAGIVMLLTFKNGLVFFTISLWLFNFASGPQYVMQTSITADALDEIQWKSHERIEGFVQNFQVMFATIGSVVATFLFTFVYSHFGLVEDPITGLMDYDILYDSAVREPIITWVIIIAICSCILSAIPFFFIKMTREKHKNIILELQLRKEKEDIDAGLTESEISKNITESNIGLTNPSDIINESFDAVEKQIGEKISEDDKDVKRD